MRVCELDELNTLDSIVRIQSSLDALKKSLPGLYPSTVHCKWVLRYGKRVIPAFLHINEKAD